MRRILITPEMFSSIWTLQPQFLAIIEPQPRNRYHNNTQKRQQTRSPFIPKLVVHLVCEQRETSAYEVADEDHTGECRGAVGLIAVNDVVEDGEDDDIDAQTEESRSDDGNDPVDRGE
jgi:hypothetical protein